MEENVTALMLDRPDMRDKGYDQGSQTGYEAKLNFNPPGQLPNDLTYMVIKQELLILFLRLRRTVMDIKKLKPHDILYKRQF
jgi:hypothetical protein